jgi:hypothetical protein
MARNAGAPAKPQQGNFVSEWFGYRTYPTVAQDQKGNDIQQDRICPFLSRATGETRKCIKSEASLGICSISSSSNGSRQDWLVCPYRALDDSLFEDVAHRLFRPEQGQKIVLFPAPSLAKPEVQQRISEAVRSGSVVIAYFQGKLGGEISLSATDRSPELSFDTTMVELLCGTDESWIVGRYGILEAQTMDFHGSYRAVAGNLKGALHLHKDQFAKVLQQNLSWLSEKIEGPNIANVFKRTFYQIMLKFKIGEHQPCVGCVLAIPTSVWDSCQRHLGRPELLPRADGTLVLRGERTWTDPPAWIYVFDIDSSSIKHPNPLVVKKVIGTDAESLAHYALKVVPDAAVEAGGSADRVLISLRQRLAEWWPAFRSVAPDLDHGQ